MDVVNGEHTFVWVRSLTECSVYRQVVAANGEVVPALRAVGHIHAWERGNREDIADGSVLQSSACAPKASRTLPFIHVGASDDPEIVSSLLVACVAC